MSARIALITDEPELRDSLHRALTGLGCEVIVLEPSMSGVESARDLGADAVVCAGASGGEVCPRIQALRQARCTMPIVVLLQSPSAAEVMEAVNAGANRVLRTADSGERLAATIEEICDRRGRLRAPDEYRVLLDSIPDVVYTLDSEARFSFISDSVEQVLGYQPSELIGRTALDLIPEQDRQRALEKLKSDTVEKVAGITKVNLRMRAKSGEVKHFEVNRRVTVKHGRFIRAEGVCRDVTERIRLEEELRRYSEELEQRVAERTEHVERSSRQLSALNEVSIQLTQFSDEDRLLESVPRLLTKSLGFDRAMLMMRNEDGALVPRAYCFPHDEPGLVERFQQRLKSGDFALPPHMVESVREDRTVFIPVLEDDPRWPREPGQRVLTKSIVFTPLRVGGEIIGVISGNMQHHERQMDEQDIERIETFANMVGLALFNIRAYALLEQRIRERTQSLMVSTRQLERKNAELDQTLRELSQSREELQAILDSSPISIVMVNNDGIITNRNVQVRPMFGLVEDPIRGTRFEEFIRRIEPCFEDNAGFRRLMRELNEQANQLYADKGAGTEYDLERIYGRSLKITMPESMHLAISSERVHDQYGTEIGRVWSFHDITAQIQADEQLRTIIDASPVPTIVSRLSDGKILFANRPLTNLIGVSHQEVIGRKTPDFYVDPAEREIVHRELETGGRIQNRELRIRCADGRVIWVLVNLETTELHGETVVIGGLADITQRKATEEAVAMRLKYEEALAAATRALLAGEDTDETMRQVLGMLREAAGASIVHFFEHYLSNGHAFARLSHVIAARGVDVRRFRGSFHQEFPLEQLRGYQNLHAGKPFSTNVETAGDAIREGMIRAGIRSVLNIPILIENELHGVIGFIDEAEPREWSEEDVRLLTAASELIGIFFVKRRAMAEVTEANRQLREAQAHLVQSEKMASLGMLVAGVAHEINTPVGALTSMHDTLVRAVERMKSEIDASPTFASNTRIAAALKIIRDANHVISEGAERVATIVRRLRSFARLDQAEQKEVDIHEGIEDSLTLVHHDLKNRVKVNREYGDLPPIVCYPGQLNQVFLNLIVNASQAMPDGGELTIRTYSEGETAYVEFRDTGLGIQPADLVRVFDPGFTTKGVGVGTGLGLSICYQIIQEHHGDIRVESTPGEGSTFTIAIPMTCQSASSREPEN